MSIICQMTSDLSSGKFFNTVTDTDRRKWVKKLTTKDGLVGVMFLGPPTEFLNPLLTKRKYNWGRGVRGTRLKNSITSSEGYK